MPSRPTKFVPIPKSLADIGAIRQMATALNALLNGSMTNGGQVRYADGNTVWDIPPIPAQEPAFFPFKVYQPTNITKFTQCWMFPNNANGIGVLANIDSTKPTNLTSNPPTINPSTDAWRFFAVRTGTCEYRPIYLNSNWSSVYDIAGDSQNFGVKFPVSWPYIFSPAQNYGTTDGVGQWGASLSANATPFDEQTTDTIRIPLAIGVALDPNVGANCAVWIQITPDTVSAVPIFQICGNSYTDTNSGDYFNIPANQFNIPVAQIVINPSEDFIPYQFVFDHINNRYPGGNGNYGGNSQGTILNNRGQWNVGGGGTVTVPADLASQYFYPGDAIAYINSVADTAGVYVKTANSIDKIVGDPSLDANWTLWFNFTP